MATPTWKRWDTYPSLQAVLSDSNGAISLSAASQVKFIMHSTTSATQVLLSTPATIASATGGYVTYSWGATDLGIADTYNVEFEIEWQAGGIETVPNSAYGSIIVVADLDDGT